MKTVLFGIVFFSFSVLLHSQNSGDNFSREKVDDILGLEQKIAHLEQQLMFEKMEVSRSGKRKNVLQKTDLVTEPEKMYFFSGKHIPQGTIPFLLNQLKTEIQVKKDEDTDKRIRNSYKIGQTYASVSESDSLVLIALYDSTDGDNWTHNDNWKDTAVYLWYGITVSDSAVTGIHLNDNNLSGNFPDSLGSLTKLDTLDMSSNQLFGSIPSELGDLSGLIVLNLAYNQLSGSIPGEIGNLSKLIRLLLYSNQLSGEIPSELGKLSSLEYLYLHHNELRGTIPPELGDISGLKHLELSSNLLNDTIPKELGNLTNLRNLFLSSNQLEGSIPKEVGNLTLLENLALSSNRITGIIPAELGDLTNLYYLDLFSNQLEGSIPPEMTQLSNLSFLSLSSNRLSGAIPAEIGNLKKLGYLYLSDNQLTDTIPPEIGQLSNLNYLYLSGNQLQGNVPPELGELSRLISLSLVDNQLDGVIPEIAGNLSDLKGLYLSSNRFSGLPDLTALQLDYLWVDNNFLTFEDLEPIMHIASVEMRYEPQGVVGERESKSIPIGTSVLLSAPVGGNHNHYQWYKDNIELAQATDSVLFIETFSISDAGTYICEVNNDSVPGLIIETAQIILLEEEGYTVTFIVSDGENPITGAKVILDTYGQDTTNIEGITSFMNVIHEPDIPYVITATGYDTLTGNVTVTDRDTSIQIMMLATGIPARLPEKISVYPNPVNNVLHISCAKCFYIEIFDITGKSIKRMVNEHEINLSGLKEGIYFLRLKNENNIPLKTIRIVKK